MDGAGFAPFFEGQLVGSMLEARGAPAGRFTANAIGLDQTADQQRLAGGNPFETAGQHTAQVGRMSANAHLKVLTVLPSSKYSRKRPKKVRCDEKIIWTKGQLP